MFSNIRYILLTAIRDRLFVGLVFGVAAASYICSVLGSTAMLEPEAMTLSFTAATSRIIIMVGIIVFIGFHVRNAFDSKEIDVLLSRPISRTTIVISYWLGFVVVASILVIPPVAILAYLGIINQTGFMLWSVSVLLESWLVVAIALFASFTLKSGVSSVLASLAMYTISRMIGFFLATLKSGVIFKSEILHQSANWTMTGISTIIPRLDFFAKSGWLIYGPKSYADALLCVYQSAIFIPLLIAAAVIDFKRKQF
jgi:ABC-type transport system involved in multi-copper enzyme maturation permease subunit